LRQDDGKSDGVNALERGFRVLDCFVAERRPLSNSEVAELTGIPRPSVTRLISTLVGLGHLRPVAQLERWELAAGVVRLAQAFLGMQSIRDHARAHLQRLAEKLGASSFLGVRDGSDVLVVEAARPNAAVAVMAAEVGTRMSLVHSALGRAWLLGAEPAMRALVLEQLEQQPQKPAQTSKQAMRNLHHLLAEGERTGYVLSMGEWHPMINAVAVPLRTADGQNVSINIGGPQFIVPQSQMLTVMVPALLEAADALAQEVGGIAGLALMQELQNKR
jgi:DNA-binding IclR family transcriptional regulator